jgi:hypothetical protein
VIIDASNRLRDARFGTQWHKPLNRHDLLRLVTFGEIDWEGGDRLRQHRRVGPPRGDARSGISLGQVANRNTRLGELSGALGMIVGEPVIVSHGHSRLSGMPRAEPRFSRSKQSGESARCKFCVAHRMRDVLVPEIILDQPGICALCEGISAWVPCVCA